jgi:hypothetical protein
VLRLLDALFTPELFLAELLFAVLFFAVLFLADVLFDVLFNGALFVLCLALSVTRLGILPSFNFGCKKHRQFTHAIHPGDSRSSSLGQRPSMCNRLSMYCTPSFWRAPFLAQFPA